MKRNGLTVCYTLAVLLLLGSFPMVRAHVRITTDVTWAKNIRPILRNKCMPCHNPRGMAPDYVDLTTYGLQRGRSGARDWAKAIEEEVLMYRMPPWKPDRRFGTYGNERRLTPEEIQLIVAWVRGGAPQGTPRDLPAPPELAKRDWSLGPPDMIIEMPEEHVIPSGIRSDYVTLTVPVGINADEWITGYEFFPGNPRIVQRVTALVHDPQDQALESIEVEFKKEYDPLADSDELEGTRRRAMPAGPHLLGQWARGDGAVLFPDEAARKLRKGSTIELQITYYKQGYEDVEKEGRDLSRLGLHFATGEVDLLVESRGIRNDNPAVKAVEGHQALGATLELAENVSLIGLSPDLGLLAEDLEVRATYPDGRSSILLWIPDYEHKWEASFVFEAPVAAPSGTRLTAIAHYDNSEESSLDADDPPGQVSSSAGVESARLLVWVDYVLDDHMIITPDEPVTPRITEESPPGSFPDWPSGAVAGSPLTSGPSPTSSSRSGSGEVYWCPMRGPEQCGLRDYSQPGKCDVCAMGLVPKTTIMAKYENKVAARANDWRFSRIGSQEIYFCSRRGEPDHQLKEYPAGGSCEVCGGLLVHKSRFLEPKTWTCLTESCPLYESTLFSPGHCPECGELVESLGHMDHNPVHGGILFMADNNYHHLEGTHPAADEFRLYFYDDYKQPLDPRNFAARMVVEKWDQDSEEFREEDYPLTLENEGDMWLTSRIPAAETYPLALAPRVWLAGEEKMFNFFFPGPTLEPEPENQAAIRLHKHGERPTVVIPASALGVVHEILERDRRIQSLIAAKDWFGLHVPAFDIIDLAAALKYKMDNLAARKRKALGETIVALSTASDQLDKAGDASDEGRVRRYNEQFREAIAALKEIFPDAR